MMTTFQAIEKVTWMGYKSRLKKLIYNYFKIRLKKLEEKKSLDKQIAEDTANLNIRIKRINSEEDIDKDSNERNNNHVIPALAHHVSFDLKETNFLGRVHNLNEITDKLADEPVIRKMTNFDIQGETNKNVKRFVTPIIFKLLK
jgi:hypothetical protein